MAALEHPTADKLVSEVGLQGAVLLLDGGMLNHTCLGQWQGTLCPEVCSKLWGRIFKASSLECDFLALQLLFSHLGGLLKVQHQAFPFLTVRALNKAEVEARHVPFLKWYQTIECRRQQSERLVPCQLHGAALRLL